MVFDVNPQVGPTAFLHGIRMPLAFLHWLIVSLLFRVTPKNLVDDFSFIMSLSIYRSTVKFPFPLLIFRPFSLHHSFMELRFFFARFSLWYQRQTLFFHFMTVNREWPFTIFIVFVLSRISSVADLDFIIDIIQLLVLVEENFLLRAFSMA